ncbi:transketolase [Selenomonas ruminantium]|uniref:Transketolase n=1 Tax=Selenomonas ruminantium TaxID=971 RepID=A0A1H0S1N5_SELRU|nr:transketolase [Selenomonas ruminantium]SDP35741.1 transketolase [Selenomonas ruminantium]
MNYAEIENHARNMRKLMLDMGKHAGGHAAHLGGAMSIADVMAVLYFGVTNIREKGMESPERDRVILSKGHASLGLYSALMEAGIMDEALKDTFEDDDSSLLGHPVQNREIGIEFTNGSLGMGLSLGIGVAIGCKKKGLPNHVYVILGDGECNEGSVWEAFMSAPNFKLGNLTAIIDCNKFQLSGANDEVMSLGNLSGKLKAFGWETVQVDGHDVEALCAALAKKEDKHVPLAVVMDTVKGKGMSFAENDNGWHHAVVTQKFYEQGLKDLGFGE